LKAAPLTVSLAADVRRALDLIESSNFPTVDHVEGARFTGSSIGSVKQALWASGEDTTIGASEHRDAAISVEDVDDYFCSKKSENVKR
jgi:hypothetical protein